MCICIHLPVYIHICVYIYIYTCRQLLASACVHAFLSPELCVLLSPADHRDDKENNQIKEIKESNIIKK